MFDFEKLLVYDKSKKYNLEVFSLMKNPSVDSVAKDQLRRASFSIMLNIAEGSGRRTNPDKRKFLVIARLNF
ncbi:MAG: four helix bundle protein [Fluviicola sp.]|nr:four helix bundle protein [Fluviicola sp.]